MQQITLEQWISWKEDIREKLKETAENFVYIGYRLRQIRDSGMLDGAEDIFEFAKKEYGLGKSTTSRFIAINEKFSNNSVELRPEYKAIGSSKLSEMLTLPDEECELITEQTTVSDIRELKRFIKESPENQNEEGSVATSQQVGETLSPVQRCVADYFKDKKEVLNEILPEIAGENWNKAIELMNPSGFGTHKKGIVFLFMYEREKGVKCKIMGEGIREYSWPDILKMTYAIYQPIFEQGETDVHGAYYKEQEKPYEIVDAKVGETAENQNVEKSVATSQQGDKEEEKDAEIVEKTPGEETAEQENEREVEESDTDESNLESEDKISGAKGPHPEGKHEGRETVEAVSGNDTGIDQKEEMILAKIEVYEKAIEESIGFIRGKVRGMDKISLAAAVAEVEHLKHHLENMRNALAEKEEMESE